MSLTTAWNDHMGKEASKYDVSEIPVPHFEPVAVADKRWICKENVCHCYGATWGCPPGVGTPAECSSTLKLYPKCALISRRYAISIKERSAIDKMASDMQNILRSFGHYLRGLGYKVLPLADGGCNYCVECSYPEPCKEPDDIVRSMGSYGIMIGEYLENCGMSVPFEEDAVTIRYLMLYDDSNVR